YDRGDIHRNRDDAVELLKQLGMSNPGEFVSIRSLALRAQYDCWARYRFGDEEDSTDGPPAGIPGSSDADTTVKSNAELFRGIYAESLYFLGLTEVHHFTDGSASHVRLSSLGRLILLGEPVQEPIEEADG